MAFAFQPRFVDLVRNYTSTTGTANFVLGAAVAGYRSFAAEFQAGESFYYSALGIDNPAEFEVGRGTMQADGTISRDPIGGTPMNFSSGSKSLALVAAAEWFELVQAGSAAAFSIAAARSDLAALADTSKPAMLIESGREGMFLFDPSDLSAQVGGDAAQGIYVAAAADTTGASGAWVRKYSGPVEASWFGAAGDGVTDSKPGIQAAIDHVGSLGGGRVRLGRGTFVTSDILLVFADDVTIDAREATVIPNFAGPSATIYFGGARGRLAGGTWKITAGGDSFYHFDVDGVNCAIENARFVKDPEARGYQGYAHAPADGFVMRNCRTEGSNGIYCEASHSAFLSNRFAGPSAGGDDAIAIKAIYNSPTNIRVIGNSFENLAYFCSIGSEIGIAGADDPGFTRGVYDVVVAANTGIACAGILFVKPGAISNYDYRDGTVDGIVVSDNILRDETGAKFNRGIVITAARGARVRNISGKNNLVIARTADDGGRHVGAVDIFIPDFSAISTAAPPTISDIDVAVEFRDPSDGAAAATAGVATTNIVAVERQSADYGTIANVTVDVVGNGCSSSGINVTEGLDDVVYVRRALLTNVASSGSAVYGGIQYKSRIRVGDDIAVSIAAGSAAKAYKPVAGTTAALVSRVDSVFVASSIAAGVDSTPRAIKWAAPRNCFVHKVEIVSSTAIAHSADDTNYTQHEVRNENGLSVSNSVSSKLTGGTALPAAVFNPIYDAANLPTTAFKDCFYAVDNRMSYTKNDFGTGNALTDASLRIHWAPF